MNDHDTVIQALKDRVAAFARERAWEKFHAPKNLAMGLAVEAAELMEHFLWKTPEESERPDAPGDVARELADVFIYTLNLAQRLGIDLAAAAEAKLEENAEKYPVELARGKALKHTHYRRKDPGDTGRGSRDPTKPGRCGG